ncbi:cytochrome bc1 complex cytochrome b subunit [Actinomycetospora sp. NBC_00405]|uniref:cytochrome bc1 complex cytochrome b subunit n=1 Tax=Actinomycetospora sp. NBC_00405 TaxID=2975952 RepID=UPI003FA459DF
MNAATSKYTVAEAADGLDSSTSAGGLRRRLNRVFPTHWSLMFGEIVVYSFVVVLVSGTWLALFFDPSMTQTVYDGVYPGLRGVTVSRAYESTVDISLEVRGGLFVRQAHAWSTHVFIAAILALLLRTFFTGGFRRPREASWVVVVLLLLAGMIEGFTGHALPDDLLSGTGLRSGLSGITLSIPVIGTWLHWGVFDGDFPGTSIIPRLYAVHAFVLPAVIAALIALHAVTVWLQGHPQFPGPHRTERNIVGARLVPTFAVRAIGLFAITAGILAAMAGLFQINPVWTLGPFRGAHVSAGSQPDWYMAFFEGAVRLWPPWEMYLFGRYTVPSVFSAAVVGMGSLIVLLIVYPFLERRLAGDRAHHDLVQRPRDAPVRTSTGVMAMSFYGWLTLAAGNDIIALTFDVSLNAMVWIGRIGLLLVPPAAYVLTYRICLGLQRADREVLAHGIETGHITRLPTGGYIEVRQPLGGTDRSGRAIGLSYQGARVPKQPNDLGASGKPVEGGWFRPDPAPELLSPLRDRVVTDATDPATTGLSERVSGHRRPACSGSRGS